VNLVYQEFFFLIFESPKLFLHKAVNLLWAKKIYSPRRAKMNYLRKRTTSFFSKNSTQNQDSPHKIIRERIPAYRLTKEKLDEFLRGKFPEQKNFRIEVSFNYRHEYCDKQQD